MKIEIVDKAFNPLQALADYSAPAHGAINIFIGTMRDFNEGDTVKAMFLDYYPVMTEKQLELVIKEAEAQWHILDVLLIHRVGEILPNQDIVLVAIWANHRGDAFDACRYIMEALKSKAPFWKKEVLINDEQRWVSHNTNGYSSSNNK